MVSNYSSHCLVIPSSNILLNARIPHTSHFFQIIFIFISHIICKEAGSTHDPIPGPFRLLLYFSNRLSKSMRLANLALISCLAVIAKPALGQNRGIRGDGRAAGSFQFPLPPPQADDLPEEVIEGTLVLVCVQNAEHVRQHNYALELDDGETVDLDEDSNIWAMSVANGFESGTTKVRATGRVDRVGGKLYAAQTNGSPEIAKTNEGRRLPEGRRLDSVGDKSVLVVRVVLADGAPTSSVAQLSDSVFGTDGDTINLKSQYAACSQDQLNFNPTTGTGIVDGVIEVTLPNTVSEGDAAVRNAVTTALNAQFGVTSPTAIADHVMYCLPTGTMPYLAYAYINHWLSVYSDQWCDRPSAQMHEVGHNLGLAHSGEGTNEYADNSGMMGYSYSQDEGPKMCFNGAKVSLQGTSLLYPNPLIAHACIGGFRALTISKIDTHLFFLEDLAAWMVRRQ